MNKIYTFLLLLSFFATNTTQAQKTHSDANILGHVVDAKSREHLPYITISLKGTTVGVVTDLSGHYFMKNLPTGEFTLVAASVGYKTVEKKVTIEPNKTLEINFTMIE